MHHPELTTIRDFIRFATTRFNGAPLFYGHGTDNAWDEAVALVLQTLQLPHDVNPSMLDAHLIETERQALFSSIHSRMTDKMPLAYLTHEAWFCHLPFYVDERVLIPRSPIAELIDNHFAPWIEYEAVNQILDLCTGSGCIAIACAKTFPEATIAASDISSAALAVAAINIEKHQVAEQVTLHEADLFEGLPLTTYDLIISNPPYVDMEDMQALPAEYQHEPTLALAAGKDGLDFVLRILKEAARFLNEKGILIVEVGNSEIALAEKFPSIPFTWISFQHGGGGVFLLTREQVEDSQNYLNGV